MGLRFAGNIFFGLARLQKTDLCTIKLLKSLFDTNFEVHNKECSSNFKVFFPISKYPYFYGTYLVKYTGAKICPHKNKTSMVFT